jgi:hypothetical protein
VKDLYKLADLCPFNAHLSVGYWGVRAGDVPKSTDDFLQRPKSVEAFYRTLCSGNLTT